MIITFLALLTVLVYNRSCCSEPGLLEELARRVEDAEAQFEAQDLDLTLRDLEAAKQLDTEGGTGWIVLKRAELRYEMASLRLAMLRSPENYATIMEAMQGQIDNLSQELMALDQRVTRIEAR